MKRLKIVLKIIAVLLLLISFIAILGFWTSSADVDKQVAIVIIAIWILILWLVAIFK